MATYTLLNQGSSGSEVKKLQEKLIENGYDLGSSGADGIYGAKTAAAVKQYQQANGLSVDGIAGDQTLSKLYASVTETDNTTTPDTPSVPTFDYKPYEESDTVKQAEAMLNQQLANKPSAYQSQYQASLDDIINRILNREKFSYDLNGDAIYQQYKDQYTQQGKMAMMDTMGQAAALTGGYGNSYAQQVGQQTYQGYLQNLNDIVPELYQMAYDRYNQEGNDLYNQYSLLGTQEEQDYGRYRDSYADWESERGFLYNQYNSERNYDYSKYADDRDFSYGQFADDRSYGQWQAEFDEAKRRYDQEYAASQAKSSSGGGGGGGSYSYTPTQNRTITPTGDVTDKNDLGIVETPAGFTGKTYSEAVAYMQSNGVSGAKASGVMTQDEWNRRKSSYQTTGQGNEAVKNFNTYSDYLASYVNFAIQNYA